MNALVPLNHPRRFLFTWSEGSWLVFDTATCRFITPVWVECAQTVDVLRSGLMTRKEIKLAQERVLAEVLEEKDSFRSLMEEWFRVYAAAQGIPYDLLTKPIPDVRGQQS